MSPNLPGSLPMPSKRILAVIGLVVLTAAAVAGPLVAQAAGAGGGQGLRAYRFVFLAYAIAWVLVFGWIVAVARRLSRLDARLRD